MTKKDTEMKIRQKAAPARTISRDLHFLERVEGMPGFQADSSPGLLLNSTSARMKIATLRRFKKMGYDITPEQWLVLHYVSSFEGICQKDIASMTFKDRPTITRILDNLEKKGLILRRTGDTDRREFRLFLTDAGRDRITIFRDVASSVEAVAFKDIPAEEIDSLKRILMAVRKNLDAMT